MNENSLTITVWISERFIYRTRGKLGHIIKEGFKNNNNNKCVIVVGIDIKAPFYNRCHTVLFAEFEIDFRRNMRDVA